MATLYDGLVRHQTLLERLKLGRSNKFNSTLIAIDEELRKQLAFVPYDNLGDLTKRELRKLVASLKKAYSTTFNKYITEFVRWLEAYMSVERDAYSTIFAEMSDLGEEEDLTARRVAAVAPKDRLWASILLAPMGANGLLLKSMLAGLTTVAVLNLTNAVNQAYANKATKSELIEIISGTKSANNKDGLLSKIYNQNRAVTNTVIQHVATQTNSAVASKFFEQYEWLSVMDDRTTNICRTRDGLRWFYGKGPLPPAHIGCRSDIVPVVDGKPWPVDSYKDWLKKQPSAFKAEGPLTLDEFASKKELIIS